MAKVQNIPNSFKEDAVQYRFGSSELPTSQGF